MLWKGRQVVRSTLRRPPIEFLSFVYFFLSRATEGNLIAGCEKMTNKKNDLELKDLGQYYGTTQYYNVMGANVTDGVGYIMQNGYGWFVTDMVVMLKMDDKLKGQEFLAVKLKVKDNKATATIEDGNGDVLYTQKYDYTDAKRDLTLYYTNNVLMLSGEY